MKYDKGIGSTFTIESKHWKSLTSYIDKTKDMFQLITNYLRDYYKNPIIAVSIMCDLIIHNFFKNAP